LAYQTSFICHSRSIQECLTRFHAVASMNLRSFQLRVSARNRYYDLIPQFLYRKAGRYQYSPVMPAVLDGIGFIGWLPYFNKRWPAGTDKFAFKQYCIEHGLRTPRFSARTAEGLDGYIIKQPLSSFGYDLRGPFKRPDAADSRSRAGENEYYEEFIPGTIAKAWYWDEKFVCLELRPMPALIGDGVHTLPQLIAGAVVAPNVLPERGEYEALARYQNISLEEAIPAGKSVLADFRYGSPLFRQRMENENVITAHADTATGRQFAEAGPVLWRSIPENLRSATLYTVDAIVDGEGRVWFLEMNCNPMGHPDAYVPMFETLFGPENLPTEVQAPGAALPPGLSHPWSMSAPRVLPPGPGVQSADVLAAVGPQPSPSPAPSFASQER
jgi:hypothetical protein